MLSLRRPEGRAKKVFPQAVMGIVAESADPAAAGGGVLLRRRLVVAEYAHLCGVFPGKAMEARTVRIVTDEALSRRHRTVNMGKEDMLGLVAAIAEGGLRHLPALFLLPVACAALLLEEGRMVDIGGFARCFDTIDKGEPHLLVTGTNFQLIETTCREKGAGEVTAADRESVYHAAVEEKMRGRGLFRESSGHDDGPRADESSRPRRVEPYSITGQFRRRNMIGCRGGDEKSRQQYGSRRAEQPGRIKSPDRLHESPLIP